MPIDYAALEKSIREKFAGDVVAWTTFRGQHVLHLKRENVISALKFLRDDPAAAFAMLTDVTCVDSLRLPTDMQNEYPERFAVVYNLTSLAHNAQLRVKAYVPEDPSEIDSAVSLWMSALWGEREAYDMYGVTFKGHPDLRRILTPDNFQGHPLRKDYPLKGRGERDNFPKYQDIPSK